MRWRGMREQRLAVEGDRAAIAFVEPRQAVEERRLAGAVGADQAGDLPRLDAERDAVERDDAAEADRDVLTPRAAAGSPRISLPSAPAPSVIVHFALTLPPPSGRRARQRQCICGAGARKAAR